MNDSDNISWLYDTTANAEAAETALGKFNAIKSMTLIHFNRILTKLKETQTFIENHLNVNKEDINSNDQVESMCAYMNDCNDILLRLLLPEFDRLDREHFKIKMIKRNIAKIQNLMTFGAALIDIGKYQAAVNIYTKAIERKPTNNLMVANLLYFRAFGCSKVGNFHDAITDCSKVLSMDPARTDARLLRADCYDYLDELEKCVEDYEFAMNTDDVKNDIAQAAEVHGKLENARAKIKPKQAERKNTDGNYHFGLKEYRLAEIAYTEAIELWPTNVLFYGNRCTTLIMLREFRRALQDAKYILSIDQNSTMGYKRMAKCCLVLGDYDGAKQAIDKLDENKEYTNLYTTLHAFKETALQSYKNKQFETAVFYADRALKAFPESIDFKLFRADCFMCLGDMEEIKEIERAPDCLESDRCYLKGLNLFYEGHLDETLSILSQALTIDSDHQQSRAMQVKVERLLVKKINGDKLTMEKEYRELVEACTDAMDAPKMSFNLYSELLYNRAMAQSKVGNISEAIADCSLILKTRKMANILLLRAECYEHIDENKNAIEDYELGLSIESVKSNVVQTVQITSKIEQLKIALKRQEAQQYQTTGDNHYNQKCYRTALLSYDVAIKLWPENIPFHKQRIACFMMLADYRRVIYESKSALLINCNCPEIHEYLTECYLVLGDASEAAKRIQKCKDTGTQQGKVRRYVQQLHDLQKSIENAQNHYRKGDFESALAGVTEALLIANSSFDLKLLKGECLALLGRYEEAKAIASSCIVINPRSADAVYVRALCAYQTNFDEVVVWLKKAIVLDPDHDKAKKLAFRLKKFQEKEKTGDQLFSAQNYREASEHLSEALEIIPIKSPLIKSPLIPNLLYKLAMSHSKIGRARDAIKHCSKGIKNNWLVAKFLYIRISCCMSMRNFRKAVEDCETLCKSDNSIGTKNMLENARNALERSYSNNYYDILEIQKTASQDDIKKAYKKLALVHHPDKHADAPANEKIEQQNIFKRIGNAYGVLSNPQQRLAYDQSNLNNNNYHYNH